MSLLELSYTGVTDSDILVGGGGWWMVDDVGVLVWRDLVGMWSALS
jgi:hypothetical protein